MAARSPTADKSNRTQEGYELTKLILTLFRTHGRLIKVGDALAGEEDLTASRWQVLGAIAINPMTVAQISRQYEVSRQGILWTVRALHKDGFVELVRNPEHKRAKLVRMTQKGEATMKRLLVRQYRWSSDLAAAFTPEELRLCSEIVTRLGNALSPEDTDFDANLYNL